MNLPIVLALSAFIIVLGAFLFVHFGPNNRNRRRPRYDLKRHAANPVISPLPLREWTLQGTFNPSAFIDDEGRVQLLYRAIGADGISRVGQASSDDGIHFNDRSMYPVFEPIQGYGMPDVARATGPTHYNPAFYTSGGGWGGSEDPRAVRIGDKVYMTYVAFEGWDSVRIGLTSIALRDFKKHKWTWRRSTLISPANQVAKNWLIFPEKIGGKFAIMHSIVPNILIEYLDSLDMITEPIKSPRQHGPQPGRKGFWDSRIRGPGAPPLKTDKGWLVLYHAEDNEDPNKYKVGAMLLDLHDPTKILYRSPRPILEPNAPYENDGKPGIVYASGAVILGGDLLVYYGGGDRHVCVARAPLGNLLGWLEKYGKQ